MKPDRAARRFADKVNPLRAKRGEHVSNVAGQRVDGPGFTLCGNERAAKAAQVHPDNPVAVRQYRQPGDPYVRIDGEPMEEEDGLARLHPRGHDVAEFVVDIPLGTFQHRHGIASGVGRFPGQSPPAKGRARAMQCLALVNF